MENRGQDNIADRFFKKIGSKLCASRTKKALYHKAQGYDSYYLDYDAVDE